MERFPYFAIRHLAFAVAISVANGCRQDHETLPSISATKHELSLTEYLRRKHQQPFSMVDRGPWSFYELKTFIAAQLTELRNSPKSSSAKLDLFFSAFEELLHHPAKRAEASQLAMTGIEIGRKRNNYRVLLFLLEFLKKNQCANNQLEGLLRQLCFRYCEACYETELEIGVARATGWSIHRLRRTELRIERQSRFVLSQAVSTMRHYGWSPPVKGMREIGKGMVEQKIQWVIETHANTYPDKYRHLAVAKFENEIHECVREIEAFIDGISKEGYSKPATLRSIASKGKTRDFRQILKELKMCKRNEKRRIKQLLDELSRINFLPEQAHRYFVEARFQYRLKLKEYIVPTQ